MKRILTTLCLTIAPLLGGVGCGETETYLSDLVERFSDLISSPSLDISDLVERDGLWYKKFSEAPFTGKVTGEQQGSFKKGKQVGPWVWYYENGQLQSKTNSKRSVFVES